MQYNDNCMEMKVNIPERVAEILIILEGAGFEAYIAGGAVRDIILGKIVYDWDFTTNAKPEEITRLFPDAFYDNKFGTVGIPAEGRPYEITTFRSEESYSDSRHPDKISWGRTLEEDLKRRDFTINAMALKMVNGKGQEVKEKQPNNTFYLSPFTFRLFDHYKGQDDLKNKLIRAVGIPDERFREDALRLMRAVRIAAELDFKIEEKTLDAIKTNAPLIHNISKERVRDELLKLLASSHPYEGVILLKDTGLLQEILPEMEKTFGVEQKSPGRHHIHDVGTHSLLSLKFCPSTDPIVRFACLIHDTGKAQTYKRLANGTITFYNHELVSARIAKNIAERLRFSNKQKERFYKLVRYHQFTVDEKQTDSAIRRFIRNVGIENIPDMLDLRVGDRLGGGARETSWRLEDFKKRLIEVQKQPFTVHDLKITGHEVMKELNIPPGPEVGRILQQLFDEVVEKNLPNEKEVLLQKLKTDFLSDRPENEPIKN
jgi:tRNA nucleotidyltransferase (CCA-adding enzyme)